MKSYVFSLMMMGSISTLFAKDFKGKVKDEKGEPVPYTNVVLLNRSDSTFVQGSVTDDDGNFVVMTPVNSGILRASCVGYETQYLDVDAQTGEIVIQLVPDAQMLGELTVKGTLPQTRLKADAMRTLVSGSVLEKAGSTTDLLNKIPSVTASGSGVEVFGRGAAEVYINGRKVQDVTELDRLRSEDIMHVDVVQNPGARYAASTKAVVRITVKKRQGEGFSFTETAFGQYLYGASVGDNLNVNYRTGGLDLTASLWGGLYNHNRSKQESDIYYMIGKDNYVGRSTQDIKLKWNGFSPQLQLNYTFNENHSLGAYYKFDYTGEDSDHGWFLMNNEVNGVLTESMMSDMSGDGDGKKHIFNAYYNGKLGNLSIDWNIDGLFVRRFDWSQTDETTTYVDGSPSIRNEVHNDTRNKNGFWASKLIFSYPVWKGNLSAGVEFSHNSMNNLYVVTSENRLPMTGGDTDIRESSTSGFAEFGRSFGRWYAMAGLRYEYLNNDYYDFDVHKDDISRSYGDWFTTLTLSYRTTKEAQLSLSYRKDIDRPMYGDLNSAIIYINKYSYQGGNPLLSPVYTNNFTFNAAYKWFNFTTIIQHIKNDIVMATQPYPGSDDPMVSLILPVNSEKAYSRLNTNFALRPTIGVWHPLWAAGVVLQNYKSHNLDGSDVTLNRPYIQTVWNNDLFLPRNWRIMANMQFTNKGDFAATRMAHNSFYSTIGVQKDFQTRTMGKFTIDVRCYDPFQICKNGGTVYGIRQITPYNPPRRSFSFDVTWRFNEAQHKYKGTGAGQSQKNRM